MERYKKEHIRDFILFIVGIGLTLQLVQRESKDQTLMDPDLKGQGHCERRYWLASTGGAGLAHL